MDTFSFTLVGGFGALAIPALALVSIETLRLACGLKA